MIWLHCVNILVNFSPVPLEFKEGERCTPLVSQQFGYVHFTATVGEQY